MKALEHQRPVEQRHRRTRVNRERSLDRIQCRQKWPDSLITLAEFQLDDRDIVENCLILWREAAGTLKESSRFFQASLHRIAKTQ
jgi:hypothetical protein